MGTKVMNKIPATVKQIENVDSLHIVSFDFNTTPIKMMSLELNNIQIGTNVNLVVKPTHVSIAKEFQGLTSFSNTLQGTLTNTECGKLLCNLKITMQNSKETVLESIITLESFNHMQLKKGDDLSVFIKSSDISILEVTHD